MFHSFTLALSDTLARLRVVANEKKRGPEVSSWIFTTLSKAERRGGGERTSGARIRGKRGAEGRETMWMRVIMFVEVCFMCLAAKSWVSERTRPNSRRTCLSARHGAQLDVLLLL